jgi:hypothetical protein
MESEITADCTEVKEVKKQRLQSSKLAILKVT